MTFVCCRSKRGQHGQDARVDVETGEVVVVGGETDTAFCDEWMPDWKISGEWFESGCKSLLCTTVDGAHVWAACDWFP